VHLVRSNAYRHRARPLLVVAILVGWRYHRQTSHASRGHVAPVDRSMARRSCITAIHRSRGVGSMRRRALIASGCASSTSETWRPSIPLQARYCRSCVFLPARRPVALDRQRPAVARDCHAGRRQETGCSGRCRRVDLVRRRRSLQFRRGAAPSAIDSSRSTARGSSITTRNRGA
jgi:hypothetical protein